MFKFTINLQIRFGCKSFTDQLIRIDKIRFKPINSSKPKGGFGMNLTQLGMLKLKTQFCPKLIKNHFTKASLCVFVCV